VILGASPQTQNTKEGEKDHGRPKNRRGKKRRRDGRNLGEELEETAYLRKMVGVTVPWR